VAYLVDAFGANGGCGIEGLASFDENEPSLFACGLGDFRLGREFKVVGDDIEVEFRTCPEMESFADLRGESDAAGCIHGDGGCHGRIHGM
jgi:hypothetical protein